MPTSTLPLNALSWAWEKQNQKASGPMSYAQNIHGGQAGGPVLYQSTSSGSPEIASLGSRAADYAKGLASQFKDYMFGDRQSVSDSFNNANLPALKEAISKAEMIKKGAELGIGSDGTPLNTGLVGRAQSFAGSNLAKGLGSALMGAAQLGLGYKSFKEGQKMNKELIKDMRTNRANLAEDRARAAKDRETFSHMMNTL